MFNKKTLLAVFLALFIALPVLANTTTTHYSFNKPAVNDAVDQDIWGDYLNDNFDSLDTILDGIEDDIAATIPPGAILPYGGTSAPSLWLLCYGQSLLRADYPALFTAIGTTYGAADGTHFNLPDLRGRVVAGQDDMGGSSANRLTDAVSQSLDGDTLGDTGGEETHTLTTAEIPAHTHGISTRNTGTFASGNYLMRLNGTSGDSTVNSTESAGGGGAANIVQPTIILNYIIYAGV